MTRVILREKHAKDILKAFEGLTPEQIAANIRKSLEFAVKNDFFTVESLVERLAENKPTPKK